MFTARSSCDTPVEKMNGLKVVSLVKQRADAPKADFVTALPPFLDSLFPPPGGGELRATRVPTRGASRKLTAGNQHD